MPTALLPAANLPADQAQGDIAEQARRERLAGRSQGALQRGYSSQREREDHPRRVGSGYHTPWSINYSSGGEARYFEKDNQIHRGEPAVGTRCRTQPRGVATCLGISWRPRLIQPQHHGHVPASRGLGCTPFCGVAAYATGEARSRALTPSADGLQSCGRKAAITSLSAAWNQLHAREVAECQSSSRALLGGESLEK